MPTAAVRGLRLDHYYGNVLVRANHRYYMPTVAVMGLRLDRYQL